MITIPAPMRAPEALRTPFTDLEWMYELKHDGYRAMAGIEKTTASRPLARSALAALFADLVVRAEKAFRGKLRQRSEAAALEAAHEARAS